MLTPVVNFLNICQLPLSRMLNHNIMELSIVFISWSHQSNSKVTHLHRQPIILLLFRKCDSLSSVCSFMLLLCAPLHLPITLHRFISFNILSAFQSQQGHQSPPPVFGLQGGFLLLELRGVLLGLSAKDFLIRLNYHLLKQTNIFDSFDWNAC